MATDPRDRSNCPPAWEREQAAIFELMGAPEVIDPEIESHMDDCRYCLGDIQTIERLGATGLFDAHDDPGPDY